MRLLVGLDVSLEKTAICVVREHGGIVGAAQVASEPDALVRWLGAQGAASPPSASRPARCRNGCTADGPGRMGHRADGC